MLSASLPVIVLAAVHIVCATVSITRHHRGDMFELSDLKCSMETCVGASSGTASLLQLDGPGGVMDDPVSAGRGRQTSSATGCRCQCIQPMPVFRDDLRICVDDLQECSIASFVSGTTVQKIPYVFLPLQGQIVYPSAEIKVAGMQYPVCAISRAKFLSRSGWVNFKNQTDFETPFQIHRENGHIMLVWSGDLHLRTNVEGRLVLIEMICKETVQQQDYDDSFQQTVTPCISFRIAGTPSVKEVLFSTDTRSTENTPSPGLTISEMIAVAICSILLGLMYVASIMLYLHMRKKRPKGRHRDIEAFKNPLMTNGMTEEGIVKNNPLLQHNGYNDNEAFESDDDFNRSSQDESSTLDMIDRSNNNRNLTTAIVHPIQSHAACMGHSMYYSDSNSIEKHPEEDVSIVETLENKEERPDNIRSIVCANPRKKLYFNPDYFELELLMAPPPAALEFLDKIREVIREAKRKIGMKRFAPNLVVIPEDTDEEPAEPPSCCNKCKNQSVVKSATIHKWLMDVPPIEVTKQKKTKAPRAPPVAVVSKDCCNHIETLDNNHLILTGIDKHNGKIEEDDDDVEEETNANIECDSLERSMSYRRNCGYRTPSEYGTAGRESSPVLSNSALPLEEELTVKTTYTYDTVTKKESYYDHISGPDCVREKPKKEILPDILNRSAERYSLVSEVYVNDGFHTSLSPCNTLDKNIKTNSPGRITIEVEDCADYHPAVDDSDGFEPDTLDRHCNKTQQQPHRAKPSAAAVYSTDSLEGEPTKHAAKNGLNSLLEIYEAKNAIADVQRRWNMVVRQPADASYLKPDLKHRRRQRCPSPEPVRKLSKNAYVRSTSEHSGASGERPECCARPPNTRRTDGHAAGASDKRPAKGVLPTDLHKYEDSGYLSTESGESFGGKVLAPGLDTDESGAESIDTDFKFFKTRSDRNYCDW
ncbi:uncharacterized protein LOC126846916 [Adelges cooleyi]|uniref:uncharacterized protein LOC126846916 n=1 Tax=Adelges cooleyi TaxID=133065 RepID=UPI00217F6301|nr:uncharacterized protein LOC126846916 [Adelges cooleyi]